MNVRSTQRLFAVAMSLVLACGAVPLLAQDVPPPTPGGGGLQQKKVKFNFQDTDINTVLEYVGNATGTIIVKEMAVTGKVRAIAPNEMSVEEAFDFLNTVLKPLGATTLRMESVIKIVSIDEAKRRNMEIHVGSDPAGIELSDKVITQIMPVHYADAPEMQKELAPILPKTADLIVNVRSNTMVMTDTSANIHRFARIVQALDQQISDVTRLKVYTLKNADSKDIADSISEVFKSTPSQDQPQQQNFGGRIMRMLGMGGRGGEEEGSSKGTPVTRAEVKATPDERTNSVIVTATDDQMKLIDELVKRLDENESEREATLVYPLRNAAADSVEKTLKELFTGTSTSTTPAGGQAGQPGQPGGRFGGLFGGMFGGAAGGGAQPGGTTASGLIGSTKVKADKDTNSVILISSPRNFDTLRQILASLDAQRAQVLVKVIIAEVTLDDGYEFGVEGTWENSSRQQTVNQNFDLAAKALGFRYRFAGEEIDAQLHMLQKEGKLRVISAPRILALDNQEASINVGRRVPFVRNSRLTDQGTTLNTIEYENIGIILKVTPHVNSDGLVKMTVAPEVSQVAPESESVPITQGVTSPTFITNTASTTVAVQNGHTVIIGGLIREEDSKTTNKTPLFGDLPILNFLFRFQDNRRKQTELMIFLTPNVVTSTTELQGLSDLEQSRLRLLEPEMIDNEREQWLKQRRK